MVDLRRVADGAYPQPDYGFLPADVTTWAGYLGGHTPHAWTPREMAAAREAGLSWWGIWTAPVGRVFTRDMAVAEAAGTVAALVACDYSRTDPVFLDVEYSTWAADPVSCEAAVDAWRTGVAGAGWHRTHWYGPWASSADWAAMWTGVRPASLPGGLVGWQYDHALAGDRYDVSVFDFDLIYPTGGSPMSADDVAAINAHTDVKVQQLLGRLLGNASAAGPTLADIGSAIHSDAANVLTALTALQAHLDAVITTLAEGAPGVHGTFTITGSGEVSRP